MSSPGARRLWKVSPGSPQTCNFLRLHVKTSLPLRAGGRSRIKEEQPAEVGAREDNEDDSRKLLYHYTTQEGLLGILTSRFVYATKIQYFNDSAEFHLTLNLAKALVDDQAEMGLDADVATRLNGEIDAIRQSNIFAVSLTEEPDLLSQWRSYGSPGSSYAIGLDAEVLTDIADDIGWVLDKCIYSPTEHRRVVGAAVDHALSGAANAGRVLRSQLLAIAPVNKHVSFEEEAEWRIFSPPLPEEFEWQFRPGRFTPVPYVLLPLQRQDGETAVREVVVGPTPHRDLAIMAIAALLRKESLLVPVNASQTTFREW